MASEDIEVQELSSFAAGLKSQVSVKPDPTVPSVDKTDTEDQDEEVIVKLEELAKKDVNSLSEEEKLFIKEHTSEEPTDEQIQTRLDEIGEKDEKEYTDEEKEFLKKYTQSEDDISVIRGVVGQKYGIDLGDKKYPNDINGFTEIADDIANVRATQILESYFESVPHMAEFYTHVVKGGKSIDTFLEKSIEPSFKKIKLQKVEDTQDDRTKELLTNNQKQLIKMNLISSGSSEEDANDLISLYEDKGDETLFEKAKSSLQNLDTKHKASVEAKIKAEEEAQKKEQEAVQETYRQFNEMIDKNNFDGLSLPATDIKTFKEAMIKVDANGHSFVDYKRAKLTLAQRALLDYIVFKDFKGIGLGSSASVVARKFNFTKKAATENEVRKGGRIVNMQGSQGEGNRKNPDIKSFISGIGI